MTKEHYSEDLFKELIGQKTAVDFLKAVINQKRICNAYLFTGPDGIGRKLATYRFLEGLLNKGVPSLKERRRLESRNHPDLLWVEPTYLHQGKLIPQSNEEVNNINRKNKPLIRLSQIREIINFLAKQPIESDKGMVVIENIEMMQESASNALLKTLEEPRQGIIILISNRPERLLPTIISRCQIIKFTRLNHNAMKEIIKKNNTLTAEEIELSFQEKELISLANGSPGELFKNIKFFLEIPKELLERLDQVPKTTINALSLARDICEILDSDQQQWLINWLQIKFWKKGYGRNQLEKLEILKNHLLNFVQPRLAWEVTLLRMMHKNSFMQ